MNVIRNAAGSFVLLALAAGLAGPSAAQVPSASGPARQGVSIPLYALGGPSLSALDAVPPVADFYSVPQPTRAELRGLGALTTAQADGITPSLTSISAGVTVQTTLGTLPVTVTKSFQGLGRGFNANWVDQFIVPPDPTLAVGPNHIVQWVNVRLTVLNKAGVPLVGGALGYVNGNAVWSGLPAGSVCRDNNAGDPVVAYDAMAGRFVLSQFAFGRNVSGFPTAPFAQCIAVSTTGDPTGSYALYEYQFSSLPDYGKLGVWPDGYYMTFNNFSINPVNGASAFVGVQTCAFDRTAMLAGLAATRICFDLGTTRFAVLPASMTGNTTPPPPGTPNYQVSQDWFFFSAPPYAVRLQKFHVDFATPSNSTYTDGLGGPFNSFVQISLPGLIGACGDNGGACVPQPGTARVLDTLSMRPMYPLQYRNRGGVESLVFTHSIDPPGGAVAGMHWIEIRSPNANPPVVRNNGALNPDTVNRWMGSAAMDKMGNIALGYSASSATVSPGIRVAGRLASDIANRLRGEVDVATGAGALTSTAQRWGDYSTMQVDPADDCTFWYTQVYTTAVTTRDWATRIVGFKFPNCN